MMFGAIARVRLTYERIDWTAELRMDPPRVDVWCGIEWWGQWEWIDEAIGSRLQGSRYIRRVTLNAIADAIRDRESKRR
jgi:hypothetical protein